jgi:hypothetical protein
MGSALYRVFQQAGLPAPNLQMEIPLGDDAYSARWIYDLFCSLLPQIRRLNLPLEDLGNLDTLLERIQTEVEASKNPVPWMALVGASSRIPANPASP